jgi:outer membrane protein assembly factor BamB
MSTLHRVLLLAGFVAVAGCQRFDLVGMSRTAEGGAVVHYGYYTPRTLGETGGSRVPNDSVVDAAGDFTTAHATVVGSCKGAPPEVGPCIDPVTEGGRWLLPDGGEVRVVDGESVVVSRTDARGGTTWTLEVPYSKTIYRGEQLPLFDGALILMTLTSYDSDRYSLVRVDVTDGSISWEQSFFDAR